MQTIPKGKLTGQLPALPAVNGVQPLVHAIIIAQCPNVAGTSYVSQGGPADTTNFTNVIKAFPGWPASGASDPVFVIKTMGDDLVDPTQYWVSGNLVTYVVE